MVSVSLSPCTHSINDQQVSRIFGEDPFHLKISKATSSFFDQVNEQLSTIEVSCPSCQANIREISPAEGGSGRFPLTPSTFAAVDIAPLHLQLKREGGEDEERLDTLVHFRRVELANIENQGKHATDGKASYEALAALSNDFTSLVDSFGGIVGRLMYYLPTSWKAHVYISNINRALAEKRATEAWLMSDSSGRTIGEISFAEPSVEKLELEGDLASKKILEVGVLLHSDFQGKGVVSQLNEHLFTQIESSGLDVEALLIKARSDHQVVNQLAEKLGFTQLKEIQFPMEGLLPFWGTTYVAHKIYVRSIGAAE